MADPLITNQSHSIISRKFDINLPKIRLKLQKTPRETTKPINPLSIMLT